MPVYIVEIPGSDFTGVKAGVDYFKGGGSTSSLRDARDAQARGCVVRDAEGKKVVVEGVLHAESHVEILTAKVVVEPEPVIESKVEEAPAGASSATSSTPPKPGGNRKKGGRKK